jgi:transposase-like protein
MARLEQFKLDLEDRKRRRFSDNFKLQKVRELELGKVKISELCKQYEVSSTSIYRWINKFGMKKDNKEKLIIETESDTKELLLLKKQIAELERIVGQKQILIDFKDKMIELAEQTYGVDIKKKFSTKPQDITGKTENKTHLA